MIIILTIIYIYVLSLLLVRSYFKIAYSKFGKWEDTQPDKIDLLVTLFPVINTVFAIVAYIWFPNKKYSISRFFGINKD